jgi:hypothetical protein
MIFVDFQGLPMIYQELERHCTNRQVIQDYVHDKIIMLESRWNCALLSRLEMAVTLTFYKGVVQCYQRVKREVIEKFFAILSIEAQLGSASQIIESRERGRVTQGRNSC